MSKVIRSVRVSEEALFTMSQKNEKEKAKLRQTMLDMNKQVKKSSANLERDFQGTKKELLELHAYRQVYQRHRLKHESPETKSPTGASKKSSPSPQRSSSSTSSIYVQGTAPPSNHVHASLNTSNFNGRQRHQFKDPFNLKKLLDVDIDDDVFITQKAKSIEAPTSPEELPELPTKPKKRNVNRTLYGSLEYKNAIAYNRKESQIFPGECKTQFSVKRFIEGEKNKLMDRFLPDGKKKHLLKRLAEESRFPPLVRSKTTSAIFREFRETRSRSRKRRFLSEGDYEDISTQDEREIVTRLTAPKHDSASNRKTSTTSRVQLLNMAKQTRRMSTVL